MRLTQEYGTLYILQLLNHISCWTHNHNLWKMKIYVLTLTMNLVKFTNLIISVCFVWQPWPELFRMLWQIFYLSLFITHTPVYNLFLELHKHVHHKYMQSELELVVGFEGKINNFMFAFCVPLLWFKSKFQCILIVNRFYEESSAKFSRCFKT